MSCLRPKPPTPKPLTQGFRSLQALPQPTPGFSLPELIPPLHSPHSSHTDVLAVPQVGNARQAPALWACGLSTAGSLSLECSFPQRATGLPSLQGFHQRDVSCQPLAENVSSLLFETETASPCTLNLLLLLCFPHGIYYHLTASTFYFICLPQLESKIH